MKLKAFTEHSWRVYSNGRCCGYLSDFGKEWCLDLFYKQYDIPKNWYKGEELKEFIQRMIDYNAYEVYSEEKAKQRGFKIIG